MWITITITVLMGVFGIWPAQAALSEEQMQQTAGLLRKMCQPKFNVEDDVVDGIKSGLFPDDAQLKCYVNCVLEMMQISKKGVVNFEASIKQINTMLPESMREPYTRGLEMCKDATGGKTDKCEASYMVLQCFHQNNPIFIFP